MKEDFLQTIWQMQLFSLPAITSEGAEITVIKPGFRNREDGPDFRQARLRMDGMEWNGAVEVHVRAREWMQHGHQHDAAYDGVILHVVWEEDQPIFRRDGSRIPALELKNRIPLKLLLNHRQLLAKEEKLACSGLLLEVPDILKSSMLETALAERMERRGKEVLQRHATAGFDWHRTAAQMLARCLGMPGNEDPMEALVINIPANWLQGRLPESKELEEVFLYLAGLKDGKSQVNSHLLQILRAQGEKVSFPIPWQKSGRRPAAFPRERIRLLASCLSFLPDWIRQEPEGDFGAFISSRGVLMGMEMRRHLKLNFEIPLRVASIMREQSLNNIPDFSDQLHEYPAENHQVSRLLEKAGMPMETAAHSQGGKELLDRYCREKRCMECRIGLSVLDRTISAE